jgi:exopolysaccharide biosynthesis polyprenyl glycosylphosphotransferase
MYVDAEAVQLTAPEASPVSTDKADLEPYARERAFVLHVLADAGLAAAVLLAVAVPYAALTPPTPLSFAGVAALTLPWIAALRSSRGAGRQVLGTTAPAVAIGSVTGLVAVAALDPWFPGLQLGPVALLAMALGVFATAAIWEAAVSRTAVGRRRVLVVGTADLTDAIADELRSGGVRSIELLACVTESDLEHRDADASIVGTLAELGPVVAAQKPDLVVLTDERSYAEATDRLLDVSGVRFRVVGLAGFYEYALGRVPIERVTPAWFMAILHLRQPDYARWTKRTFDVAVAVCGLIMAAPLLLAVALAVRTTGSPVLYRQTRVGEGGRLFTILKFRTMCPDAERDGACFACENDNRATSTGRFLRRTHLDELPQLWNVLKGEMSVVGPRPERPEFVETLERTVPFWTRRSLIKPGVTGWAQLSCGYAAKPEEMARKLSYDLWYLRHRSLALDLAICARTVGALVPRRAKEVGG